MTGTEVTQAEIAGVEFAEQHTNRSDRTPYSQVSAMVAAIATFGTRDPRACVEFVNAADAANEAILGGRNV